MLAPTSIALGWLLRHGCRQPATLEGVREEGARDEREDDRARSEVVVVVAASSLDGEHRQGACFK